MYKQVDKQNQQYRNLWRFIYLYLSSKTRSLKIKITHINLRKQDKFLCIFNLFEPNKYIMYFSKPEDSINNSFTIHRGRLDDNSLRITKQDRNEIKINKSKLPFDFFKKSLQRSLPRKSAIDSTSNRLSLPKTTVLRKYPHTQRKINSYNQLPESAQIDYPIDYGMAKTHILRPQVQQRKTLNRKALLAQINTSEDSFQQIKTLKDYVKPKCIKRNQALQILQTNSQLRNLIKQRFPSKFCSEQLIQQSNAIPQEIDMGCTFGKGFKISQNQHETSIDFANTKSSRQRYQAQISINKRSCEQKSTQQSEVYQGLKSNDNSPIRAPSEFMINPPSQQGKHYEHPKPNKIQWNIYKQDLSVFQGLNSQKSKEMFTAQQKQRKSKYRINNSSNDYRQKTIRKEKRLGQLNLPKINKVTQFSADSQV